MSKHNGDYVEKLTSFVHIPSEYLCQLMNFSANPCIHLYIYIVQLNGDSNSVKPS